MANVSFSYIHGKLVSNGLLINDELDRINIPNIDIMIEEYRQEAMIKYKIANIFTDGEKCIKEILTIEMKDIDTIVND
jgi:hypothetical protein